MGRPMKLIGDLMRRLAALVALTITTLLSHAATPEDQSLPDGAGKAIVQRMCVGCHSLKVVTSKRATHDQWNDTVQLMVSRGADGSDEDIESVINYLSTHFGLSDTKTGPSTSSARSSSDQTVSPASPATSASSEPPASKEEKTDPATPSAAPAPASPDANATINVNTANAQELEKSLGLTEKEAQAVVQYREQNGKFKYWQTVATIPGVPVGKIENNRKRITF
jgi:competence ComEA-like helix-hairpin-helix protein